MAKAPKDYTQDEVLIWLNAIGLGSKISTFQENSVDGDMLVNLTDEDYVTELGLTNLQARKLRSKLEFSDQIAQSGGGGDGSSARIAALEAENTNLQARIADLEAVIRVLNENQQAAPPPPPPHHAPAPAAARPPKQPQQQRPGRPVVREGARGAARGAMLGAIGGAIAGDAGKGAKIGAAMGGTSGGLRGLQQRRRRFG